MQINDPILYVFDWDGTLHNSLPNFWKGYCRNVRKVSFNDFKAIARDNTLNNKKTLPGKLIEYPEINEPCLFEFTKKILELDIPKILVTSNKINIIKNNFPKIEDYFEKIYSSDLQNKKPSKELATLIQNYANTNNFQKVIYIGDTVEDYNFIRHFDWDFIYCEYGFLGVYDFKKEIKVIKSDKALYNTLLQHKLQTMSSY